MSRWNCFVIVAMLIGGCYHETSVGSLVTDIAIRGERLEISDCDVVYEVGFDWWNLKATHELATSSCRAKTLTLPPGGSP
jgi:hypothetical protein